MTNRLVLDKAGRLVIPKPLREELHLEPGDALEMESAGDRHWPASATDKILDVTREERDLSNLGGRG